jgi:prevent-host-death family protein
MSIEVPSRELRNDTRGLLARAQNGEEVVITVRGTPVARLSPIAADSGKPRWVGRDAFVRHYVPRQADPDLRRELDELAPDTTDDVAWT